MPINKAFGRKFKEAVAGETQGTTAERLGISQAYVSRMVGGSVPQPQILEKFVREYGLDLSEWRMLAGYEAEPAGNRSDLAEATADVVIRRLQEQGVLPTSDGQSLKLSPALREVWQAIRERWEPQGVELPDVEEWLAGAPGKSEADALAFIRKWDAALQAVAESFSDTQRLHLTREEQETLDIADLAPRPRPARKKADPIHDVGWGQQRPSLDLSQLRIGQHDSPQNRYDNTVQALYVRYTGLGWKDVPHPQLEAHFSGGQLRDDRHADQLLAAWLETLHKRNPGKPEPEELAGIAERLAE